MLPFLLPYLELRSLHEQIEAVSQGGPLFDIDREGDPYWQRAAAWELAQWRIEAFVCPSDDPYKSTDTLCRVHFFHEPTQQQVICGGGAFRDAAGNVMGRTNYLGVAGAMGRTGVPYWDKQIGVFANRSKTSFRQIEDGTSETLLFGEVIGGPRNPADADTEHYAYSWFGCGAMGTAWGFEQFIWARFNSRHPRTVAFCNVDGSVRELSKETDMRVLIALSSIHCHDDTAPPP